jgi:hypothetical protein
VLHGADRFIHFYFDPEQRAQVDVQVEPMIEALMHFSTACDPDVVSSNLSFCWYRIFLSVDSRRLNPASSAAFSNAPFANLSHPRAIASTTV